ncbi:MAG: hypothetical protein WBD79_14785, partial [Anaerolineae bacterium]
MSYQPVNSFTGRGWPDGVGAPKPTDTSNPLKRVAVVGTGLDSGGLLNAKTPGRKDAKDIRESDAH